MFYLFAFQMLSPFSVSPPQTPIPSPFPASMRVFPHPPTCSPPHHPSIPLHWGIEPSQDQGPLFLLMPDKTILCYICRWSHGSLHMYSLVGVLVPGSSGKSGWLMLFILWGCKLFQSFLWLLYWGPHAQSNGWLWASSSVFFRLWSSYALQVSNPSSYSSIRVLKPHSLSRCWSLYLLESAAGWSLSEDSHARLLPVSITEYH